MPGIYHLSAESRQHYLRLRHSNRYEPQARCDLHKLEFWPNADGMDPIVMPAVNAPTPGGLTWLQIREFIHGIVNKGRVLGIDLVEISPQFEKGNITFIHAERLLCNFIGATVRADYFEDK